MAHSRVARLDTVHRRPTADEAGQGLVEYALILLFVAIAAVGTLTIFGTSVSAMFTTVAGAF